MLEKLHIKNRVGERIAVVVEAVDGPKGLAFISHGLSGNKDQEHIVTIAEAIRRHGYVTVRFDTTNTFGESDGSYEDATATKHLQDLEDVIAWASTQQWYEEPFGLAGHSLGAMTVTLFAENHPDRVAWLMPVSLAVSGKEVFGSGWYKEQLPEWRRTGWLETTSTSRPDQVKRLKFAFYENALNYDVMPNVDRLGMPTLMIIGDQDGVTTPGSVRRFHDALPGPKEMKLIEGAPHTFKEPRHLEELNDTIDRWLSDLR